MARRLQLDREALLERVSERSAGLVAEISTILLGGVLSAAGFGMIEIFRHPTDWPMRVILWLISMIACFIVYFRLATRAPFYMTSGSAVFVAMPLVGVSEILLFAVLTLDAPGAWRYWFFAAVTLSATGVITNILELRRLRPRHYAADTEAVFAHLRSRLRAEAAEAAGLIVFTGAIGAVAWALPRDWPYLPHLMGGYLALSALIAVVIVPREARETERLVEALHANSPMPRK
jgi:hypothetical protein